MMREFLFLGWTVPLRAPIIKQRRILIACQFDRSVEVMGGLRAGKCIFMQIFTISVPLYFRTDLGDHDSKQRTIFRPSLTFAFSVYANTFAPDGGLLTVLFLFCVFYLGRLVMGNERVSCILINHNWPHAKDTADRS